MEKTPDKYYDEYFEQVVDILKNDSRTSLHNIGHRIGIQNVVRIHGIVMQIREHYHFTLVEKNTNGD